MTAGYGRTIGLSLRLSVIVLLAYGGMLFLTYYVFKISPTGFVPQQDQGRLIVSVQLPDSASLKRTEEVVAQVEKITRDRQGRGPYHRAVRHFLRRAGQRPQFRFAAGHSRSVRKTPEAASRQAESDHEEPARDAGPRRSTDARVVVLGAAPIPGLSVAGGFKVMVENRGGLELSTLQSQTDLLVRKLQAAQYKLTNKADAGLRKRQGARRSARQTRRHATTRPIERDSFLHELGKHLGKDDLDQYKDRFLKHARQPLIGLKDVSTQFRSNTPQIYLNIDRNKVASLGVSLDDVNATLENYLGSLYVNSFNEFGRYWQVTIQADDQFRSRIENINLLQVRNNKGQMVLLGSLIDTQDSTGPIFIRRYNLYTAAPITGGLLPGVSSGDVISDRGQDCRSRRCRCR